MANLIFCEECGGLKCDESMGNYSWEGEFCHCDEDNQPNIDMGDYEYDPVAKIHWPKPKKLGHQKRREEARRRVKFQTDLARAAGITVEQLVEELLGLVPRDEEPPTFKDNEQKMTEEEQEMAEAYAAYTKQEIRFCSYCGAALGVKEDE